ncbi:MAG: response regulator transcription factor [Actinomycetes bacterium]
MNSPGPISPRVFQSRPTVLVVDDEASYREALTLGLEAEGFAVVLASSCAEAEEAFSSNPIDIALLDVMLPDGNGSDLCRRLLSIRHIPILMVSARDDEVAVVLGLEFGAADYVTKPFRLRELVARMRAVLRRNAEEQKGNQEQLKVGPLVLDLSRRELRVAGTPVELSRKEFELMQLLMERPGQVVTRDACIDHLWYDTDLADTRTLDTHVRRLRRKIEPDPTNPVHLLTVRGIGFRCDP